MGENAAVPTWDDEQLGRFWVHPATGGGVVPTTNTGGGVVLTTNASEPVVIETPSTLQMPTIPEEMRCRDPPLCFHGEPTKALTCKRSPVNQGRVFYTCTVPDKPRCGFFRWADENANYTEITLQSPMPGRFFVGGVVSTHAHKAKKKNNHPRRSLMSCAAPTRSTRICSAPLGAV